MIRRRPSLFGSGVDGKQPFLDAEALDFCDPASALSLLLLTMPPVRTNPKHKNAEASSSKQGKKQKTHHHPPKANVIPGKQKLKAALRQARRLLAKVGIRLIAHKGVNSQMFNIGWNCCQHSCGDGASCQGSRGRAGAGRSCEQGAGSCCAIP